MATDSPALVLSPEETETVYQALDSLLYDVTEDPDEFQDGADVHIRVILTKIENLPREPRSRVYLED